VCCSGLCPLLFPFFFNVCGSSIPPNNDGNDDIAVFSMNSQRARAQPACGVGARAMEHGLHGRMLGHNY